MQENTRNIYNQNHHHFDFGQSIFHFLAVGITMAAYVLSPEDSSENRDDHTNTFCAGALKSVFWIAASICLAVFIGQLN